MQPSAKECTEVPLQESAICIPTKPLTQVSGENTVNLC